MAFGAHMLFFSTDADADRAFFSDVLGLRSVDAGGGWLLFALPPAEVAFHPADAPGAQLYLMVDDLHAEIVSLTDKGVTCSGVEEARWGSVVTVALPGGGTLGLYQPKHPLAIDRSS
ncbi:MAG TPA: hypothetical protein VKR22_15800 [Acidimicrobiales bacterium]|nr:hypothetical protein [Acidimicrobiales bacterium]